MKISRRQFLMGCSAAIAAMSGARLTGLGFADPAHAAGDQDMLVTIFLRGGIDGLNLAPPYQESEYYVKRPNIAIPVPGSGANAALDLDGQFGLHSRAQPLLDLYQNGDLAVIHAAGLTSDTRSHFDAMAYMERGTPGDKNTTTGWMTRHLLSAAYQAPIPALAASATTPTVLLGSDQAVATTSLSGFNFSGNWLWQNAQRFALRHMYTGDTWLHRAGEKTLNAIDVIELANPGAYTPEFGAVYPAGTFGSALKLIAQVIKLDIGLQVANVDLGGWDTHEGQGGPGPLSYFSTRVNELANGLMAFYTDLTSYAGRLTIVVLSEFGRRLRENNNQGTDHGHGNVMLALGGNVNGGQVFTDWPGLEPGDLDGGQDLAITVDYRQVLSEIVVRRLGNPNLGIVFPGYTDYAPLGVVSGPDLPVNFVPPGNIENVQNAAYFFNQPATGPAAIWDSNQNGVIDVNDIQVVADRWDLYWRLRLRG